MKGLVELFRVLGGGNPHHKGAGPGGGQFASGGGGGDGQAIGKNWTPKERMRIRVVKGGAMAGKGEEGIITELRGWNFDGQKKNGRWLVVQIDKMSNGGKTRRGITINSNEVEPAR